MNSIQIEYFLALAKHLNFSETARLIHVSQPAISKQITSLEEEIGIPLFERGYRSIKLTPAGERFHAFFLAMNDQYDTLREDVLRRFSNQAGQLRIGCINGMSVRAIPIAVGNFQAAYPEHKLFIEKDHFQALITSFEDGVLDIIIALRSEVRHRPNITYRTVEPGNPMLGVSRSNPIAQYDDPPAELLKKETFLVLDPASVPSSERIAIDYCQQKGFTLKQSAFYPNNDSIRLAVESNLGIALFHPSNLDEPGQRLIRAYPTHMDQPLVAAWKKNTDNRYAEIFIQELLRHVEADVLDAAEAKGDLR